MLVESLEVVREKKIGVTIFPSQKLLSEKAKRERRDAEEIKEEQVQEVRVDSLFLLLRSSTRERDSGEHGETNNCLPTPTAKRARH